ncbi:MAG: molecular chaperone DnaJ [Pseudomonadales bacterium]|nr:molecular chaperone DnaJ [Pseudomonadales bacterium]
MIRLLLVAVLAVFVGALLRLAWLRMRGDPRRFFVALAVATLVLVLLFAIGTGRLHWLFSIPAALLPFLGRIARLLPILGFLRGLLGGASGSGGRSTATAGGQSRVETAHLRMTLDLETGALEGELLTGAHAGRRLSTLDDATLLALLEAWRREDPDSARLLETWLDRTKGSAWRGSKDEAGSRAGGSPPSGELSRADALSILGLDGEPERDAIVRAHRRLMQQFHPDHGGSDYLAALVNRAKERLLDDL